MTVLLEPALISTSASALVAIVLAPTAHANAEVTSTFGSFTRILPRSVVKETQSEVWVLENSKGLLRQLVHAWSVV